MKHPQQQETTHNLAWLHQQAGDNLRFIRENMERSTVFTGISGKGYVLGGLTALPAAWLAAQQATRGLWLSVWLLELLLASSVMLTFTARKCLRNGTPFTTSPSVRKLLLAFVPAMFAGGLISFDLQLAGFGESLPALWLTLYGAAIITAGAWSIRVIPLMGGAFMLLGALAAFSPINNDLLLACGFGGLHIGFGAWIWRTHGG